jgi:DNA-binding MarR family transcriptional regulator
MQLPPALDPVFHQVVRTRLSVLLNVGACSFSELKTALGVTDGNLDAHLRKLSAAGYLHSQMIVRGRPQTLYALSPSGKRALAIYLSNLKAIIEHASNDCRCPPGR